MALVVEDGTGLSTAESYITVTDADTYATAHGDDSAWDAAIDAEKEEALRLSAQYLDFMYGPTWKGVRSNEDQALNWPRTGVIDPDGFAIDNDALPQKLKDAQVEAAIRHNNGTSLFPDLANDGDIASIRSKVDSLEEAITYVGAGSSPSPTFPIIRSLLLPYLSGSKAVIRA